jgi:hypothetical protein
VGYATAVHDPAIWAGVVLDMCRYRRPLEPFTVTRIWVAATAAAFGFYGERLAMVLSDLGDGVTLEDLRRCCLERTDADARRQLSE